MICVLNEIQIVLILYCKEVENEFRRKLFYLQLLKKGH